MERRGLKPVTLYARVSRVSAFFRWLMSDPQLSRFGGHGGAQGLPGDCGEDENILGSERPLWTRHDRAGSPGAPLTSRAFVENLKAYAQEAGLFLNSHRPCGRDRLGRADE
jgi:hypothetical protein